MQTNPGLKILPVRMMPADKMKALSLGVLEEAVAGLLWMSLKVPKDASRSELQDYAHDIVRRVQKGASEIAIAERIKALQCDQLCDLPNVTAIRDLTRRILDMVKQSSPSLQSAA